MKFSEKIKAYETSNSSVKTTSSQKKTSFSEKVKNYNTIDEDFYNSFVNDVNSFFSSASTDLGGVGWSTASSTYDARNKAWQELNSKANRVGAWMESNKGNMDEEQYNNLSKFLEEVRSGGTSTLDLFKNAVDYYSKWDTEAAYNKDVADNKALYDYDLEAGKKEIDLLNSIYKNSLSGKKANPSSKSIQDFIEANPVPNSNTLGKHDFEYTNEVNPVDLRYGDNMRALITEKTQLYNKAKRAQDKVRLESVADPTSENYDKDFVSKSVVNPAFAEDTTYAFINDIDDYRHKEAVDTREFNQQATFFNEGVYVNYQTDNQKKNYAYINDDEIALYNYYYNTEGKEKAEEYLNSITETLNYRAAEETIAPYEKENLEVLFAIEAGLHQASTGIMNLFSNEEYIPTTEFEYASGMIREGLADNGAKLPDWLGGSSLGQVAYDALSTTANMLPSILVSKIPYVGAYAGPALLGASAAGNAKAEMLRLGYSKAQANTYGILIGTSEAVLEKLLGGIPGLSGGDGIFSMLSSKALSKIDNALARAAITIAGSAADEALEEGLQTVLEPLFAEWVTGVDWDDPNIDEVLYSSLLGALSSIGLGGGASIFNEVAAKVKQNAKGQSIIDEGGVDLLKNLAYEMQGANPNLQKAVEKASKKTNAKNVGNLLAKTKEAINTQNRADIKDALAERGLNENDAERIAEYLSNPDKLTKRQLAEIDSNEKIQEVVNELLNDKNSPINQRDSRLISAQLGTKLKADKSGELAIRNEVDVSDRVSNEGKTSLSDGQEIAIDKTNPIAKIEYVDGERVVYFNTDHGTVKSTDVNYADKNEALLYESFTDMDANFANIIIRNYDKSVPVETYINGMREGVILYGMHNYRTVEDIPKNTYFADLSEADQEFALKLGREYAKADADKANATLRQAIKNAAEKAKASEGATTSEGTQNKPKKSRVSFEKGVETGKQHKKIIALAKHLASAIGIDIVFYDSRTTSFESGKKANGFYDEKTDTIYLDLQNAKDDAKTIAFTLSHELVHFIKKWSPAKFNTFADFLMEQYAVHGVSSANLLKRKMAELNTTDVDYAYEEMIADACETMLLDSNAMVKLMELRKSDLELFDKIKLHVLKILNSIREAYKRLGYQPSSDEAKALLGMKDVLEKFYSLFEEAAVDATKNYQALGTEGYNEFVAVKNSNETVFGEASVDVGKTESGVKHQLKAHKTVGEASIAYNDRHKKVHKAILQVGVESMYEMAEAMLPYLEVEGILPPDIPGKTIFKNGSYGKTGENTTLCVRTLTYEDFKDRVAEKIGRPLTVSESLLVSQKIYDIATEPQCIYCYVAADRKAYDEYLGEYWKAMDKYIKAMRKGGDSKALYTEYLAGRKDTDAQKKRWSQWEAIAKSGKEYISASDLTTKRKRDSIIAKKNAFSDQIKDAQRYAQSASWAKTVCDYRAYKGDILKMTSTFVDMLNSEYGLRMYSFSDYTPAFIVENMQMIIDASVKGLKSLAYTKDTDYVEIFASTGQAINVSCFAKWDAELGTYVEDNRQGANWEKTKNLRKQYRNVGAVMVATNDAMVEWALKQDWVDVVIPYHIVKTGTTIANEYQWNNYTSESSDKAGNRTANIYPTEHNNDFATYSDLLKERGITPRFSRWYDMVESGELTEEQYMKLVNEVRLPASELSPVVPSFNLDAAKKSFGIDNEGNVIKGGFVDKGGYMGGWYRQGVDVNQEVMAVSEDIEAGKSSLDVDYGMSKAGKERVEQRFKRQAKTNSNILSDDGYSEYNLPITYDDVKKIHEIFKQSGEISVKRLNSEQLKLTQKWAYKFYNDIGIKSPFFTAWFGEWRAHQKDVFIDVLTMDRLDGKNPRGQFKNEDTGWVINSSSVGYDETISHSGKDKKSVIAMRNIDKIIKNAVLFDTEVSHPGRGKKSIYTAFMHKFYAPISINGKKYIAKMAVDESYLPGQKETNKKFYHVRSIEIETASSVGIGFNHTPIIEDTASAVSIADLYRLVKYYDKEFTSAHDVSPSVMNDDGTPRMFDHTTEDGRSIKVFKNGAGQIKSAETGIDANIGTFDGNDSNIHYQKKKANVESVDVTFKGKPFWIAMVNQRTGNIEATWTYEEAEGEGFDLNRYEDIMEEDGYVFFTTDLLQDNDRIEYDDYGERLPDRLIERINEQIKVERKYSTEKHSTLDEGKSYNALKYLAYLYGDSEVFDEEESVSSVPYDESESPLFEESFDETFTFDDWLNGTKFQKKKTSNRTILANALDTTAQNDIEKNKLAQYKEKIALIESEEEKLAELKGKIKELSFAPGRRDTEAIKKLQFEANKTTNRINTYDRMLLNLESTAALKGVLEREKQKAYKRAEEKGREALDAYREKMLKKQSDIITQYQESRKRGIESRNKTELRHKIQKVVKELNNLLLNPTKDKHVPIGLEVAVAQALEVINMDTVGADERVAKYDALIAKTNDPEIIKELTETRDRIASQGEKLTDKLNALKVAYADIKNDNDRLVRDSYSEVIENLIDETIDDVGDTSIREMTYEQLESVYDMYKAILTSVRNANKMFKADRQQTITENSEEVKAEVKEVGGHKDRVLKITKFLKKFGWNNLKPIYAMKLIGSKTLTKLYENVRKGEDTWAVDVNDARNFFRETARKYGYKTWDLEKQYTFKDSTGKEFSISLEQIMSLYAYSKRKQADKHLEFGGFIFDDSIEVTEKKKVLGLPLGIPLKYEVNDANPYRLNKQNVGEIVNLLETELKDVKGFVDEMQAYLSDVMGAKGNEVSLAMYDIKLYKEKYYFPLKSAKYFREFDPEKNGTPKIKNSGFSKKTVPQAGNPIVLSNFMDVWANHVNDMAMYHSFVLPLEDFMRVYNYSSTADGYDSVQQYIKNAYGIAANSYIETLMNDLNGGARTDPRADLASKLVGLFKKTAVFMSASVVVQQPSAIARAVAYIDPKYFVDKPNPTKHSETWAEVKKYAPVAIIKEMGYFDTHMGKSTVDFITSKEYDGFKEKFEAMFTDKGFRDEALSKAPALADELAWCAIWKAVKRETLHTHPKLQPNSEAFLKAVGERFTEVITLTQVYDSVLSRSAMMRSKDGLMKMATAFMSEPTTSVNMLVDAIVEGKRGNKAFTGRAIGAVVASMIINSILVSFVYATRDDDEEKTYSEKYIETLVGELISSGMVLSMIPFIKDIVSIFQGYDVERADMAIVSDIADAFNNLDSKNRSAYRKVEDFAGAIAAIFGLPVKNIMRDARGMYNLVTGVIRDFEKLG